MRLTFDSIDELKEFINKNRSKVGRKSIYSVCIDGVTKYVLGNNTDHAIATMVRADNNVAVKMMDHETINQLDY